MIFQQVYGFGKVSATIKGAPGETVTYTGAESGSVELDSDGEATVTLKSGDYSLTGSVSNYTATCRLRPQESVMGVYPENYIYWYGRIRDGHELKTGLGTTDTFRLRHVTQETNDIEVFAQARAYNGTAYNTYAAAYFDDIDLTGFTTINFSIGSVFDENGSSERTCGQATNDTYKFNTEFTVAGDYAVTIDPNITRKPIGVRQYLGSSSTSSWKKRSFTLAALWLE